jgi:sigma-B regulation protein RsbU (phosphoserine phosphatase)
MDEQSKYFDITIINRLPAIEQVNERFNSFADENNIPRDISRKMNTVFDEFINNIVSYAHKDENMHEIEIRVELTDNALTINIIDDGVPFDPFATKTPDTTLSIEDREIGGLGIHIVRNMMDSFNYQRKKEKNIVSLVKHLNNDN